MASVSRKHVLIALAVVVAGSIAYFIIGKDDVTMQRIDDLQRNPVTVRQYDENTIREHMERGVLDRNADLSFEEVIALLRNEWGRTIHSSITQLKMLQSLMKHCQRLHPEGDEWLVCVQEHLEVAFPALAAEIFEKMKMWIKYQNWLRDNTLEMTKLSREERKKQQWEKRREIFGDKIAEELWDSELRGDKVYDAVQKIGESDGKTMTYDQKLDYYKSSIDKAYEEEAQDYIKDNQQMLLDKFTGIDTVQDDLETMTPQERKQELRKLRSAMGLDEAALKRWDQLDDVRDQRWSKGEEYMKEREAIVKDETGSRRDQKLDELRKRYFGTEAESVKSEEESNFFRFTQKRVYGQN